MHGWLPVAVTQAAEDMKWCSVVRDGWQRWWRMLQLQDSLIDDSSITDYNTIPFTFRLYCLLPIR